MRNKYFVFCVLLLLLLLSVSRVEAREATISNAKVKIVYEDRIVQGETVQMSIQIRFNMSKIEVIVGPENGDPDTVYLSQPATWISDDWVDLELDEENLPEAGNYKGRVLVYPQNSSYLVETLFFEIFVEKVFDNTQIVIAMGLIGLFSVIPFIYDIQKRKMEVYTWNNLSMIEFLKISVSKLKSFFKLLYLLILISDIIVIGFGITKIVEVI